MKMRPFVILLILCLQTVQFCVGISTRCNQYSGLGFQTKNCKLCTRMFRCAYYIQDGIGNCISFTQVLGLTSRAGRYISSHSHPYPKHFSAVYRAAMESIKSSSLLIYWHQGQCQPESFHLSFEGRGDSGLEGLPKDIAGVTNFASSEEEDECKDKYFNCRYWALIGECTKNAANMHRICKKSCGICKPEPCEDKDPYCADWASIGECKNNPLWMGDNCARACKICTPEICQDHNEYCSEWASLGECDGSNRAYMVTSCSSSCNVCQPDVIQTTTAPLGRQCYTCGTSLETSGDFCDDKLTGTYIYCKNPEDICLLEYADDYDISTVVDITMGCNDGKYTDDEGGVLINNKQHFYLTCNTTKNCSPYWFCNNAVQNAEVVEACEEVKRKLQWENELDKIHA